MIDFRTPIIAFISLLALLAGGCQSNRLDFEIDEARYAGLIDQQATSPGTLISKRAIDEHDHIYFLLKNERAFAQSTSGAWGWTHGRDNIEDAMDEAVAVCRQRNRRNEAERPCQIVNINGYWTGALPSR